MAHADSRVMGALEPRLDAGLRPGGIEAAVRVFVSETRGAGRNNAPGTRLLGSRAAAYPRESRWAPHRVRAV